VEVPSDPGRAGWFFPGTVPGQHGSTVILGHVDSTRGPAVFYRLHELVRGDRFLVRMSDGSDTHFTVTRVATYPNAEFPAQRVYAGTPGRATLSLVTCGGDFDADAGGYQANVVVFAQRTRAS
jgi:sortase (surface protein transpeptidase)